MPEVSFPAPAGPLPAYLAVPAGEDPWPGVVVIQDGFGLTADLRRITNYGLLPKDIAALGRSCPMVASYGGRDRQLRGAAAKLEAVLADGGVPHDVKEYPDVGHAFMNDWGTPGPLRVVERMARLTYSEPEAEDAWRRILAFFAQHLT